MQLVSQREKCVLELSGMDYLPRVDRPTHPCHPRKTWIIGQVQGAQSIQSGPTSCSGYTEWRFTQPHGSKQSTEILVLANRGGVNIATDRQKEVNEEMKKGETVKNGPVVINKKSCRLAATSQWTAKNRKFQTIGGDQIWKKYSINYFNTQYY